VHGAAAGIFLLGHRHACDASKNRRGCGEQKEDGDDTGEAAHRQSHYSDSSPFIALIA
jgi:hypothetical protein